MKKPNKLPATKATVQKKSGSPTPPKAMPANDTPAEKRPKGPTPPPIAPKPAAMPKESDLMPWTKGMRPGNLGGKPKKKGMS